MPTKHLKLFPWLILPARTLLFAGIQACFALGFLIAGSTDAWQASAAWWPFAVTITNLICVGSLITLFQREGKNFWHIFRFERETLKNDLLTAFVILLFSAPIAMLPNILAARWLFGDQQIALALFIRPLPEWAKYASLVIFPTTIALGELPTYYGYIMPRLESQTQRKWLSILLPAFFLAAQHIALPLVFTLPYLIWRLVMFIPFAVYLGILLHWRPRLLPYLVIMHALMDLSTAALLFTV
jgi:hypothetical protein